MKLPTLYKKTSAGKIQYWKVWTKDNEIHTAYGQLDGKEQTTVDIIKSGKNVGRSNETTPKQQAEMEAKAYWDKKKKRNYVEQLDRAENKETDVVGGIDVMLAHKFSEQGHKINWPAFVQPKLDGIRMIAIVHKGECTLWTRTRKPITGLPHIQRELAAMFPTGHVMLDGEAYNHKLKTNFEKITSFVRQDEPIEGHEVVEFHVYDIPTVGGFAERYVLLDKTIPNNSKYIKKVDTFLADSEDEAMDIYNEIVGQGYEGIMLRNGAGLYAQKRSYDLQKVKEFDTDEFAIVGVEEGRGKLIGHAAKFVLKTKDNLLFKAKLRGSIERLKELFENPKLWKDKQLTVQYQGLTAYGIPRFPVGTAIRDYE